MKRRSFLSLSALSAVPVVAKAADVVPEADWWETINNEALTFKAVTDEGKIILQVELIRPAEHDVTEALDEKGEHRCYEYQGKDQPYTFRPGVNLVKRFDLTWDCKATQIPERFWNDPPDLRIATSTLNPETLKPEIRWKAERFLKPPSAAPLNLLRWRHRPHRMGTRQGMRLPLHHPLDRQQIQNGAQTQALPAT